MNETEASIKRKRTHSNPLWNRPKPGNTSIVHGDQWRIQDFPEEGALTPKGGHQPIIWPIFPENFMKMKRFWARGGRTSLAPPLDLPLVMPQYPLKNYRSSGKPMQLKWREKGKKKQQQKNHKRPTHQITQQSNHSTLPCTYSLQPKFYCD